MTSLKIRQLAIVLLAELGVDPKSDALGLLVHFSTKMYHEGVKEGAEIAIKSIENHIVTNLGGKYGPN